MKHIPTLLLIAGIAMAPRTIHAQRVFPVGTGITGSHVNALAVYDGKLFIGGRYQAFNGHERRHIQGWDGVQHYDMPGAFTTNATNVNAMLVYDGVLVVAGREPDHGHALAWDGSEWTDMGPGLSAAVHALAVHQGQLFAGTESGQVVRWTGADWTTLGQFDDAVLALASHSDVLYAGGRFNLLNGATDPLHGMAAWNGSTWTAVSGGLGQPGDNQALMVTALKSDPSGLLVGGTFTASADGTQEFPYWARFDGSTFLAPTSGPAYGPVRTFLRTGDGKLFIGGGDELLEEGSAATPAPFRTPTASIEHNSEMFIAGNAAWPFSASYETIRGIARFEPGTMIATLDINAIRARGVPSAVSFLGQWGVGTIGFEAPTNSEAHSIYAAGPWLFGHANGVRHVSMAYYGMLTPGANWPEQPYAGPQATVMDHAFYERYHRVWKLDRAMVQAHIAHWNAPGYTMPEAIATWPGNGDVQNGEPLRVAPFMDLDGDDIYEPEAGEYPLIRGDQAIYTITHTVDDRWGAALQDELLPLDLHIMTYAFESNDPALEHTVFVNYRYVNRSTTTYTDVRFGQFADIDVGCPDDDFAGCDSTRSLFYAYNWDDYDETCQGGRAIGYGEQPPAQGVKFLNTIMRSHSLNPREGPLGQLSPEDLMYGLEFGEPFMDTGYPSHFKLPGGDFAEVYPTPSQPDRRSLAATGPFTLAAGDTLCFDMAFIYARASSGGANASVEALKQRSDSIQTFYDGMALACNTYPVMTSIDDRGAIRGMSLFPNPASTSVNIHLDRPLRNAHLVLRDALGREVLRQGVVGHYNTMPVQGLSDGVYLLEVCEDGERRAAQRLVVQ